jgi:hypothetical protein
VLSVFRLAVPGLTRLGVLAFAQQRGVVSAAELAAMRAHLAANPGAPALEARTKWSPTTTSRPRRGDRRLLAAKVDAIWIPIDITVYQNLPIVEGAWRRRRCRC